MQPIVMRWTIRIGAALTLLWLAYAVSPYVAAYRLASAVQARDVEAIKARVNFRAVRVSLARQILAVHLNTTGDGAASEAAARQLAAAAIDIAEPLLAELLSPEVLVDFLDDGWPQTVASEVVPEGPELPAAAGERPQTPQKSQTNIPRMSLGAPQITWRDLLTMVDTRGFRKFYLTFPGAEGAASRVRLYFRFGPWTWRLYGIEIPDGLARRLADELRKRIARKP